MSPPDPKGAMDDPLHIVIVGGGFGGLAAAGSLKHTPARITLIDRTNHHLFQPLLYQVATAALTTAQIASPIRGILRKNKNTTVIMGEVTGVDKEKRRIFVNTADREGVPLAFDYLILATGARHSYFGHNEYERFAPGLKSLSDALAIRNKILSAFEQAEAEEDPARHKALLTFVLVGAGPSGVELSGAMAILLRKTFEWEFRRVDPATTRIVLIDMAPRVLGSFPNKLSEAAKKKLERLGVEVRLGQGVDRVDEEGVVVAGERIFSNTVLWTAGVAPSPAGKWLDVETDRAGRVKIQQNLTVPGHPEIFVIGDTASLEQDGRPLPGVAQVAIQQGRYAGRAIHRRIVGASADGSFRYFDKGNLAVVAKGFAILQTGKICISGFSAWLVWALVHISFLAKLSMRIGVLFQWGWYFLTNQFASRLIIKYKTPEEATAASEHLKKAA